MVIPASQLIESCIKQDISAQKQFYNTYYKLVYNSCYRILSNALDAEDCMQESFIKAFNKMHTLGDAPVEAWLRRIAINTAIDGLKKKRIDEVELDEHLTIDSEEMEDESETKWKVEQIRAAVMELPDKYRIVLSLSLFEGYDYQEIAEILTVEETTVRSQYSRGRQKLINKIKICF